MGFQSSPTTAGISIPASLVIRLPERTTPGNRTIPRKRTNPIDEAKINRKTNSSKSDYPINVAKKRRITSRHTRESRVQPQTKQNAAKKKSSRTPTGFQILSGENLHQAGESSERRGPASAVTTTSSQSPPAYAFYIDPRPLLTPQRQLPSAQPLQRRRHILPPKAGEIKAQHPQSQLPYHSPTKDFMILVSPRRLPQHNGSSTFFELVDEERYIKTAQYPLSRDIDRRQAGIERMRYPLFFAPPLTSGREVT
ncbi:hypothetical protein KEM54_003521 [Ascosphaera aggregata]|nr:hypothetical protein KEM54_003521 [Ascosphaera aggregata]